MKTFTLGDISLYLLLPFIAPVFICLRSYVVYQLGLIKFNKHPFVLTFLMFLGELIGGSYQIILYLKQYKHINLQGKEIETLPSFNRIKSNEDKWSYKEYCILFSLACIDLGGMSMLVITSFLNTEPNNLEFQMKTIQMIITGFIGIKMLGFPIFRHHYTSMLLIVIGMLMITIETLIDQGSISLLQHVGFLLLGYSIYSFEEVTQKYLMQFKFVGPFLLLLWKGCFGICLCIILFICFDIIPCPSGFEFCEEGGHIEDIFETLELIRADYILILYLTAYCFLCLVYNVLLVLIEKIFSPTHKAVSDTIASLFWECILYSVGRLAFDYYKIAYIIGYVFRGLGTLIYNEIIICHFFGLEKNTIKEIKSRASQEDNLMAVFPDGESARTSHSISMIFLNKEVE